MVAGDLRYFDPGDDLPVELVADPDGTVAARGDLVELVGETDTTTQAQLVATAGAGVGALHERPAEYDPDGAYAAGDVVGGATVHANGSVDWYDPAAGYDPAVGDLVVAGAGGVIRAYDAAGGDTADMILGRVFATGTRATSQTAGKAAVLRSD